jgi:glycosyltransferase involved in cell wall biosynthesis
MKNPFFTIAITTYNRVDFLRETLKNLVNQPFTDFEIIIGNDYILEPISLEIIGIFDSRIKIINHKVNLGELENMNSLLKASNGRYFTWLFDDDPCSPSFLNKIYATLEKYSYPTCIYSSFKVVYGHKNIIFKDKATYSSCLYSGKDFLTRYLSGNLKALGCCGFYDRNFLKELGGVTRLSNGPMALNSEYLLIIQAGLVPQVAYINEALVSTRTHQGSWTTSNLEADLFKEAGLNLVKKSLAILQSPIISMNFELNLTPILSSVISSTTIKICQCSSIFNNNEIQNFILRINNEIEIIESHEIKEISKKALRLAKSNVYKYKIKYIIKRITPFIFLKYLSYLIYNMKKIYKIPF